MVARKGFSRVDSVVHSSVGHPNMCAAMEVSAGLVLSNKDLLSLLVRFAVVNGTLGFRRVCRRWKTAWDEHSIWKRDGWVVRWQTGRSCDVGWFWEAKQPQPGWKHHQAWLRWGSRLASPHEFVYVGLWRFRRRFDRDWGSGGRPENASFIRGWRALGLHNLPHRDTPSRLYR